MVNIFDYIDYRQYLRDAYAERRAESAKFSYRYIAGKVGFASPGFFANVLAGKKDISLKLVLKFADLFRLGRKEKDYFEALVLFTKATGTSEKKEYLDRLLAMRGPGVKKVEAHQWEYFEKWHHTAVRELIALRPFRGDFRALAAMVNPPITVPEARKSIELLERLGLIRKGMDGSYERTDAAISAGDAISQALISAYQVQAMDLAKYAMDNLPSGTRNFSTLTMSVSAPTYEAMLEELRGFRRRLLEMAEKSEDVDRVYQMNFHVFPLTTLPAPAAPAPRAALRTLPPGGKKP
ncbi:MAG TPA: TIGR02147 family protein [Fibrobacteria bacterium]|nr:TIGR02147 family protein [Fibrobacteria bacterium]